jgi:endonuclease/exonuclease/phosphatase family metal-dependent hydrolase
MEASMSAQVTITPETPYGALIETRVRVVTWNVWWRYGDWRARLPAIGATLKTLDPDIVCLQEAWRDEHASQSEILASELGLAHAHFAPEREANGVTQGLALLSRWPLRDPAQQALPTPADAGAPNIALRAFVDGPRGPLLVTTTHLTSFPMRSAEREAQVRAVVDFVAAAEWRAPDKSGRTIITGDFNAPSDSDEIRLLTGRRAPSRAGWVFVDAWDAAGDGSPGHTFVTENPHCAPTLMPNLRWDYIFVRWPYSRPGGVGHPLRASVAGAAAVNGMVPSDHYAVVADLRY